MTEKDNFEMLLFGVRRSVKYHSKRRQFFDRMDKTVKILSTVSGMGAFSAAMSNVIGNYWVMIFAASIAIMLTADLVISASEKARRHSDLMRRFVNLEQNMIKNSEVICSQKNIEFQSERLDIEAEEPTKYDVLDIICHNEIAKAMGRDDSIYKIGFFQRLFRNLIDISPHYIKKC